MISSILAISFHDFTMQGVNNAREVIPSMGYTGGIGQVSENERVFCDCSVSKHRLLLY
jgi:hypothetical protein